MMPQKFSDTYKQELMLVDHPSGLTPMELAFCRFYAMGGLPMEAYFGACSQFTRERPSDAEAAARAGKLLMRPVIKKYLQSLLERLEDMGVASMLEVQMFLTEAIRTPIDSIDGKSVLCQKKVIKVTTHKDGSQTETTTFESVNKLDAVKTLSKMKGWDAPIKVDVNHSGGVMLVPMAATDADWETAALDSQKKLMQDAIDV